MENTGHISFGYAQFFLMLVLLPTICNIIKYTIDAFRTPKYIPDHIAEPTMYIPTGNISYYTGDHIYKGDHINGTKTVNQQINPVKTVKRAKPSKRVKQATQRKITQKPEQDLNEAFGIIQIPETSHEIRENTAKALKNLGFKIVEAKKIIRKLCINKCYQTEEDLISDAIRNIKN